MNYLVRLGWSHGDQEIFSRGELIERFDIKDVSASGAVFDVTKLEWLSQEYLKSMPREGWPRGSARSWRRPACPPTSTATWLRRMVDTLRERAKTLRELVEVGRFYFERPTALRGQGGGEALHAGGRRERLARADRAAGDARSHSRPAAIEALSRAASPRRGSSSWTWPSSRAWA